MEGRFLKILSIKFFIKPSIVLNIATPLKFQKTHFVLIPFFPFPSFISGKAKLIWLMNFSAFLI